MVKTLDARKPCDLTSGWLRSQGWSGIIGSLMI